MGGWGQADVKAVARLFLIVFQEDPAYATPTLGQLVGCY